jgi:hypothetical protein
MKETRVSPGVAWAKFAGNVDLKLADGWIRGDETSA